MKTLAIAYSPPNWDQAIRGFLAEKERRSGSARTAEEYGRLLKRFFATTEVMPDQVAPDDVFAFAYGKGPSGKEPSGATVNLRLAAVSSFYDFLLRMELTLVNPCVCVQRSRQLPSPARGLDREEARRLLDAIPNTAAGVRDRAIILTCLLTGRRRAEVLSIRASDLIHNGSVCFYTYRGKGGQFRRRELPAPCVEAIEAALERAGTRLATLAPDQRIFNVSSQGFYLNFRRYLRNAGLPEAGVHLLRHTAAKFRRDVGASVEEVSAFLDHGNLAVTTTYLRRLEGDSDSGWRKVAAYLSE